MAEVKQRRYVIKSLFDGLPKREDLEIVEETLPPLKDGGRNDWGSEEYGKPATLYS